MNGPSDPVDRERLAGDPELGVLLRRANVEYRVGLDEPEAFRRVSEQLEANAPRPRPRAQVVTALGLAFAAAAGWLMWLEVGRGTSSEVLLGPEVSVGESVQRPTGDAPAQPHAVPTDADGEAPPEASREGPRAPLAERVVEPAREGAPQTPRSALSRDALDATRTDPALEGEPRPVREPRHESPSRAVDAPRRGHAARSGRDAAPEPARTLAPAQEDCLELARRGESRAAERCFDRRATGSGLGAEMALYEVARLRRDVLSDAVGALAALSAYRERFARGSLRNEVDLSRVELLADLGRSADALRESAALLGAASGRERAAELHQLRGDVYRRQLGDLRAAAAEYAQVEALGGARGAEASRSLGACLEGLGDIPGALAAYRRYVREPGRAHAAEIQRRIDRLDGSVPRSPSPR